MKILSLVDSAEKNDIKGLKEILINKDVNEIEDGRNALHAACITNAIDAADLLIKNGINVNSQDSFTGATPLHYCSVYNYYELAKLILENNGQLAISDNHGNEPLWTAVFNVKGNINKLALVKLFLSYGADRNHKNSANRSPLDFANQVKFSPLLELMSS